VSGSAYNRHGGDDHANVAGAAAAADGDDDSSKSIPAVPSADASRERTSDQAGDVSHTIRPDAICVPPSRSCFSHRSSAKPGCGLVRRGGHLSSRQNTHVVESR